MYLSTISEVKNPITTGTPRSSCSLAIKIDGSIPITLQPCFLNCSNRYPSLLPISNTDEDLPNPYLLIISNAYFLKCSLKDADTPDLYLYDLKTLSGSGAFANCRCPHSRQLLSSKGCLVKSGSGKRALATGELGNANQGCILELLQALHELYFNILFVKRRDFYNIVIICVSITFVF